jgi:hypothetical protein
MADARLIPWEEVDQRFSFTLSAADVALAYQQSQSIVTYLIDRYGFWRIRRLLKSVSPRRSMVETLSAELRLSSPRLERNWREWLATSLPAP